MKTTQVRLSTGKKVNSALDNPTSFFASVANQQKASDLSSLKDGIEQATQVIKAADAGMNRRSRAHGARLNCSKQLAVAEPVVTEASSHLAQRDDFGMSGRIAIGEVAVPSSPHHAPGAHHDCSHRHFARLQRALGAAQGFFHPQLV